MNHPIFKKGDRIRWRGGRTGVVVQQGPGTYYKLRLDDGALVTNAWSADVEDANGLETMLRLLP